MNARRSRNRKRYLEHSPFFRLLATRYDPGREPEAVEILEQVPELARLEWRGPDANGQPLVKESTASH